jgi:uncharacterized protein (DUF488 family)
VLGNTLASTDRVSAPAPAAIWTIGHSSRTLGDFLELLQAHGIEQVADVRRYAGSRAHPHFNPEPLAAALTSLGIDYMETPEFRAGLERLVQVAAERRTALLCSEAVWWRCHRSLIADALKADGIQVLHIMDGRKVAEHPYTSAARIVNGKLQYGAGSA